MAELSSTTGPVPTITGTDGNDRLTGNWQANVIDGRRGADVMTGGKGNDYYYVDNTADEVVEGDAAGVDTVQSTVSHTLDYAVEKLILAGTADLNGTGNGWNNTITGNSGANRLSGGSGYDILAGAAGNDLLIGGTGNDTIDGGTGTDTAVFSRSLSSYSITKNADGSFTVKAKSGTDGTDTVKNVESLQFSDKIHQLVSGAPETEPIAKPEPEPLPQPEPEPDPIQEEPPMTGSVIQLKSGATQADIQSAINNAKDGTTIVLPKDAYIKIGSALKIDASTRDITLDLNGSTLKQAGNDSVIEAYGHHTWTKSASLGTSNGNTIVKLSSTSSDLHVGDWIKIVSDDSLPGSSSANVRMGQAMQVTGINGGTVTVKGQLLNQSEYDTNVRVSSYESGDLTIRNGTVQGDQSQSTWKQSLVWLDTLVAPRIDNLTVRDNNSMAITVSDAVHAHITDSVVKNLKDNTVNGNYGYGVLSKGSLGTLVEGLYAETVRHAIDSANSAIPANYSDTGRYGADIGMTVRNAVAYTTTSSAYSWHSEANHATLENVQAFDSAKFATLRGLHGTLKDSVGVNTDYGLQLYQYGNGDGRDMDVSNITLREVGSLGVYESNDPSDIRIDDSRFEAYKTPNALSSGTATITDTSFKLLTGGDADTMTGTSAADKLFGGKATDKLSGTGGNDQLWGGAGADTLSGGAGSDRFIYHNASEGGDVVTDFTAGSGGDVFDVGILLTRAGYRDTDAFSDGYIRVVQSGSDTLVQFDSSGGGNSFGTTLARLQNVDAKKVTAANFDVFFGSDGSSDQVAVLGAATDQYNAA